LADDAAVIDIGGMIMFFSQPDGIWGRLVNASPWWAGYTSVLVNVNDIAAMAENQLPWSMSCPQITGTHAKELLRGIQGWHSKIRCSHGGRAHAPDTPYTSLAVAI